MAGFDNASALRTALAEAARRGRSVALGPGIYDVSASRLLREGSINRPSGVALEGSGQTRTTLRVTGVVATNPLFSVGGASNVITREMRLVGNGRTSETAPYAGGVMYAVLAEDSVADMMTIAFEDCLIEGFASATWFHVLNLSRRFVIRDIASRGCVWRSTAGGAPGAGAIGVPGHFIYAHAASGPIERIVVDDVLMDAAHCKGAIALVGGIRGASIRIAILKDPGLALATGSAGLDGSGAYGVLIYQKPGMRPRSISVAIGRLANPVSVGVYAAGGDQIAVRISEAFGQRDTRDQTLPKAVVALKGCRQATVQIDRVRDCARVVALSLESGIAAEIALDLRDIISRKGARDVLIGATGSTWAGGVTIRGSRRGPAAIGVGLSAPASVALTDIDIASFRNTGAEVPLEIDPQLRRRSRRLALGADAAG
ncbi:MAG: hypothetical protein ACKVOP_04265 [Sphingomonadaceae bacterium]